MLQFEFFIVNADFFQLFFCVHILLELFVGSALPDTDFEIIVIFRKAKMMEKLVVRHVKFYEIQYGYVKNNVI